MKRLYLDSGALVKLYVFEPGSEAVQAALADVRQLSLNPLQETEVRTAIHAAAGRGLLDGAVAGRALAFFDQDVLDGRWIRSEFDWAHVWERTRSLSDLHASATLCRTLDLLHIALAQADHAGAIITGDKRQAEVCRRIAFPVIWVQ